MVTDAVAAKELIVHEEPLQVTPEATLLSARPLRLVTVSLTTTLVAVPGPALATTMAKVTVWPTWNGPGLPCNVLVTETSITRSMIVVTELVLLLVSGSVVSVGTLTVAVFTTPAAVVGVVAVACSVTMQVALLGPVKVPLTVLPEGAAEQLVPVPVGVELSTLTAVKLVGTASLNVALVTVLGPALVINRRNCTKAFWPTVAVAGAKLVPPLMLWVLTMDRSDSRASGSVSEAVQIPPLKVTVFAGVDAPASEVQVVPTLVTPLGGATEASFLTFCACTPKGANNNPASANTPRRATRPMLETIGLTNTRSSNGPTRPNAINALPP